MPDKTLRSPRDFHRVRSSGVRARSDGVTVWLAPAESDPARLGLAPRSKRAVDRNRIRRRVRAAWAELTPPEGRDAVVGADDRSLGESFQELVRHVERAVVKAEAQL